MCMCVRACLFRGFFFVARIWYGLLSGINLDILVVRKRAIQERGRRCIVRSILSVVVFGISSARLPRSTGLRCKRNRFGGAQCEWRFGSKSIWLMAIERRVIVSNSRTSIYEVKLTLDILAPSLFTELAKGEGFLRTLCVFFKAQRMKFARTFHPWGSVAFDFSASLLYC